MSGTCSCTPSEILLFSCSGAANVGQISNSVATELNNEGKARMLCIAALGGHVEQYIDMTKQAKRLIVIDGCPVACGKKIMEHNGFTDYKYLLVTEEGIEKGPGKNVKPDDIVKIKSVVEKLVNL